MANFNYNRVILGGRLTGDPDLRTSAGGSVSASFNLAINRKAKQGEDRSADFFRCVAFGEMAESITKFFRKGSSIMIEGRIQNNNWTDKSGVKRYQDDIIVSSWNFVDSKNDAQPVPSLSAPVQPSYEDLKIDANLEPVDDWDNALPF